MAVVTNIRRLDGRLSVTGLAAFFTLRAEAAFLGSVSKYCRYQNWPSSVRPDVRITGEANTYPIHICKRIEREKGAHIRVPTQDFFDLSHIYLRPSAPTSLLFVRSTSHPVQDGRRS